MWIQIIGILLFLVLLYSLRIPMNIKYWNIPGDPQLPFFGHRLTMYKDSLDYELKRSKKYPILMKAVAGGSFEIAVTDFNLFRKVSNLSDKEFQGQLILSKYREALFKYSIFLASGNIWQDLRFLLAPAFNNFSVKEYVPSIKQAVDNQIYYINESLKTGQLLDLLHSAKLLTLSVIVNALFGINLQSFIKEDEERLHQLADKTSQFMKVIRKSFSRDLVELIPDIMPLLIIILGKAGAFKTLNEIDLAPGRKVLEIIREKSTINDNDLYEISNNLISSSEDSKNDFKNQKGPGLVAKLLKAGKIDGSVMNEDRIAANISIMMIAGHDTTSLALTFAIHQLSVNKIMEKKILQEIDAFGIEKELDEESLDQFPYVKAVVTETLRLFSPVVQNFRVLQQDTKLAGYKLPKGTHLTLPVRAIHLSDKYYPKPREFHPERWLPNPDPSIAPHNPNAYFPFGYGPRVCIGMKLALVEAKIALIKLYQNFVFEVPKGGENVELQNQFTILPKNPVLVQPIRRK